MGQFMTPPATARFMADLFPDAGGACRLIDAGAGLGALSCAFIDRWNDRRFDFTTVSVDAFEVDDNLRARLSEFMSSYKNVTVNVTGGDFIELAVARCISHERTYTHAILNPPYKKINNGSQHRQDLRRAGLETVNLYSAFVALALDLMAPGGVAVAIIPRSFCNGPYYQPFREWILERSSILRMHLFDSRKSAFKADAVLQENIIIVLERDGQQGEVVISTSTDDSFDDLSEHSFPFGKIVFPGDRNRFIHVPTSVEESPLEALGAGHRLEDLGLKVSTGPVVDFRMKNDLVDMPAPGTVPLLYAVHFAQRDVIWPILGRKPNALAHTTATEKWLYPNGWYCVARRFSAKEERRRVVAGVCSPNAFPGAKKLGFENHLNVFHAGKVGLPEALAKGLATYLNTTAVDEAFRRFNGHTQVNATDLRSIGYPSIEQLTKLGNAAVGHDQSAIDTAFLEAMS